MDLKTLIKILSSKNIAPFQSFRKIEVGFINDVFSLDNEHIMKVCKFTGNQDAIRREAKLYRYFESKMQIQKLITYDDSKSLIENQYMIYQKIQGENLYNIWHTLSDGDRKVL